MKVSGEDGAAGKNEMRKARKISVGAVNKFFKLGSFGFGKVERGASKDGIDDKKIGLDLGKRFLERGIFANGGDDTEIAIELIERTDGFQAGMGLGNAFTFGETGVKESAGPLVPLFDVDWHWLIILEFASGEAAAGAFVAFMVFFKGDFAIWTSH